MKNPSPVNTFLQEAEDLLDQIEQTVLEVKPGEAAGESIHHLFRAFHTIKGSGAMFGFDTVAAFTHHVETVLDKVRDGVVPVSTELVELILASRDQIKALLQAAQGGPAVAPGSGEAIIASLNVLLPKAAVDPGAAVAVPTAATQPPDPVPAPAQTFRIRFRPAAGILAGGTNPVLLLNELRGLGSCQVQANSEAVPSLDQLQADQCYLTWEVTLATDHGVDAIRDVFIFVQDESDISIEPVVGTTGMPGSPSPATETTPIGPALDAASPGTADSRRTGSPAEPAPVAVPRPSSPGESSSEPDPRPAALRKAPTKDSTVRVPSERLDRLVTLVGEMVMNQSRLTQVAAKSTVPELAGPVEELERLVAELRDNVLSIRMMAIGTTFNRYKRLVHDLSGELGKEIDLLTEGAETELDKTVLDQLGDPLVHLIRNCIDHGIEPAEAREQAGKPRHGTIRLAAAHTGSTVVITIADDGRGLDTQAIRAKAEEKKLIARDSQMSREELFNLIFLPGFSTARQITSVSGRGVGMDVVRRQIDTLRGSIHLDSELNKGTTVSLTLPLTLAIIDGLLVEIGGDQFIIPMSAVTENVELLRSDRTRNNGRNLITVRGELVPYLRLRELFGILGQDPTIEKIVLVRHGADRVGLAVDRVLGSHQTVIQSLGRFYRNIEVVSGATIMGDGRVALILDVGGLVRRADRPDLASSEVPLSILAGATAAQTQLLS